MENKNFKLNDDSKQGMTRSKLATAASEVIIAAA
jgi:hypothetical protein